MRKNLLTAATLIALGGLVAGAVQMPREQENHQMPTHSLGGGKGGKGRNKHPRGIGRNRLYQRAAQKKRNQARHRRACRG